MLRDALFFEWEKIKRRRLVSGLLIGLSFLIPIGVRIILQLDFKSGSSAEGLMMGYSAYSAITFPTGYFFIPVWILILIGMEFSNGHVARITFLKSKKFYFLAKVSYCVMVSIYFTILAVVTFAFVEFTASFQIDSSLQFYIGFAAQAFYTFLSISLLLLAFIFLVKSPVIGFVGYILIHMFEGLLYTALKGFFSLDLYLLPIQSTNIFYVRSGVQKADNFYNPFIEFSPLFLFQPLIISTLVWLAYTVFMKKDIEQLSD